jgi:glycosyltransferase involved in cell wall biosynthesis
MLPTKGCFMTGVASPNSPIRISIGLCAWNEADRLPKTIRSLSRQDCFRDSASSIAAIQLIVVANACTDATVTVAQECLYDLKANSLPNRVTVHVEVTDIKGKANAWNIFVHQLSDPTANYLISMDCDIELLQPNVISRLVEALTQNTIASIARPICRKNTELKASQSLADKLALLATRQQQSSQWYVSLPGAIYCGRTTAIRSVWQPLGMIGDDGHLRDMIVTENWRCPTNRKDEKIILVDDVEIAFEAHSGLRDILWHQVRSRIGLANRTIFHRFLDDVVGEEDASQLAARLNIEDPEWYRRIIQQGLGKDSWWVMPWPLLTMGRLRQLGALPLGKRFRAAPIALLADLSDFVADLRANREFRRRRALRIWR